MEAPVVQSIKHGKLVWMDIKNPDLAVLNQIKDEYGFHELDVEDCLSEHQRAKIDEYEGYLFLIAHVPAYDKRSRQVHVEEIDIFVKKDLLITVHWGGVKALGEFWNKMESTLAMRKQSMEGGSGFLLYKLLNVLTAEAFPILDQVEKSLSQIEKEVFVLSRNKDMLKDILTAKKNIITLSRLVAPERQMMPQLEHMHKKFMTDDLAIYFDDIVDTVEKHWMTIENLKELVESLHDTNESILSHNTNNVIKILTIFSVLLLPLTFLTGLYGMNVPLPFAEGDKIFYFLLALMITVVTSMMSIFKYKDWI